jgi:tRNA threonylcarbamoyladenosine biosynthesis protein TsaE
MKLDHLDLVSHSPEETRDIGARLGKLAEAGDIFLLIGELGTGKTCLTQGIARGLDIKDDALSPSFVIMRELYGRLPLYHIDLFRLERLEEIEELGLDDYLYGSGVCVVEWAERGLPLLTPEHLLIELSFRDDTQRNLNLKPSGEHYRELLTELSTSSRIC